MPNYKCARIPLPQNFIISAWRHYLSFSHSYDKLLDYMEFGWPINFTATKPPTSADDNHHSARAFAADIDTYISKELSLNSLLGPFPADTPPFMPWLQINALMTAPKKGSDTRRTIVDLSWPTGSSVNDAIPRDIYDGTPCKLLLPTADHLIDMILKEGQGCYLYSRDLARSYRQLRSDPLDWPLLCFRNSSDAYTYSDISIAFGLRWGAWCCSSVTNALCDIMIKEYNAKLLVYIDDYVGLHSSLHKATADFENLASMFKTLGVQEATHKSVPPTTKIIWLGLEFDTVNLILKMPEHKINATLELLQDTWLHKSSATRKQIQQLLGKLLHISRAVKPARLFVSRMLETLRQAPVTGYVKLSEEFLLDAHWFMRFLRHYNGIHMMVQTTAETYIEVDSCLSGCGGICGCYYYHSQFPDYIMDMDLSICHKEMLNIVLALKLFANAWQDTCVKLFTDNSVSVSVLSSGRSRDSYLLACAREVWLICAQKNISLLVEHKAGVLLQDADSLSREHLSAQFKAKVEKIAKSHTRLNVSQELFNLTNKI